MAESKFASWMRRKTEEHECSQQRHSRGVWTALPVLSVLPILSLLLVLPILMAFAPLALKLINSNGSSIQSLHILLVMVSIFFFGCKLKLFSSYIIGFLQEIDIFLFKLVKLEQLYKKNAKPFHFFVITLQRPSRTNDL